MHSSVASPHARPHAISLLVDPGGRHQVAEAVEGDVVVALDVCCIASDSTGTHMNDHTAEVDRTLLYLGVFLLVALVARRGSGATWADGLAAGISAIALVALSSRLFPTLFSQRGLATFLPASQNRLSFPLGYWNGLGIFCALAVPLLLRVALVARSHLVRGLALAPLPVIAADIYLASSRGAVATLIIGTVVLLAGSPRRPALVGAIGITACGAALTIGVLLTRRTLVDGPARRSGGAQ